ncbi:MAG TPA: SET domain-containing protein-lysine N-methyltransferase [Chitinophagaceae bacterium]|nr:SET domain-containing protein-lysine N-methyltransferase [Chitinophagaceae bacterium]
MQFNTASKPINQLVLTNDILEVWKDEVTGQHSAFSMINANPGDIICDFGASAILQTPSYLTVQVNETEHICLQPSFLQYINHSCSPNVCFDTTTFKVICLQPIKRGDELSYFYPSTEWAMAQPFQCVCGFDNCLGYIQGASYLSKELISSYRFTDFIFQKLTNKYSK